MLWVYFLSCSILTSSTQKLLLADDFKTNFAAEAFLWSSRGIISASLYVPKFDVWKGTPIAHLKALQSTLCNLVNKCLGALKKTSCA